MFYELYHLNLADNSPTLSGKMCKMCDPNLKHCSCSCGLDECGFCVVDIPRRCCF